MRKWVLTELYSSFVINQVVRDDVAPAELAHLHSELVRYLGASRNNRLSAQSRNINFLRVKTNYQYILGTPCSGCRA